MSTIGLLDLPDEVNLLILKNLSLNDYAVVSLVCKKMNGLAPVIWQKYYQQNYSALPLEGVNPWRDRIKLVESELAKQKIDSDRIATYAKYGCELLGTLRPKLKGILFPYLNVHLNKLIETKVPNAEVKKRIAAYLLECGAQPLIPVNLYLSDSPLKTAITCKDAAMTSLFLNSMPKEPWTIEEVKALLSRYVPQEPINQILHCYIAP